MHGEVTNAYKILIGKPIHRWDDNINMDLEGIVLEGADRLHVTQGEINGGFL
jgi:hypothetical protein